MHDSDYTRVLGTVLVQPSLMLLFYIGTVCVSALFVIAIALTQFAFSTPTDGASANADETPVQRIRRRNR